MKSKQKIGASVKEALWLAHGKKCAYTSELLDVRILHIDHIIPESVAHDPVKFAEIRSALGLATDFDVHGYENLLPCHPDANLRKGYTPFEQARALFFLELASRKKSVVEANLVRIQRRNHRGKAIVVLQEALEDGLLEVADIANLLEDANKPHEEIFSLIAALPNVDGTRIRAIAKADIHDLCNMPIRLGRNEDLGDITLANDNNVQVQVSNCSEYDEAVRLGFYPMTTYSIKMATYFEHRCGLFSLT